jgi:glutathione S-transferase
MEGPMLTLFHAPKSRSSRFLWLLEELEALYTLKLVTIRRADGTGGIDPTNPHPHGKVPVIVHDGATIFESPALALYLTDTYPKNGIGPRVGEPDRGAYLSWLAYYGDVLEPAFISKFLNAPVPRGTAGWVPLEEVMEFIVRTLSAGPFLLGDKFSATDVLYGSTFALFSGNPLLPKTPVIDGYVKRCIERPAYIRAMARDDG